MPVNTGYLGSGRTTDFQSNVSVGQNLHVQSGLSVLGVARVGSTLSVDGAVTFQGAVTMNAALNSASAVSGGVGTFTQVSLTSADFASVNTGANASSMTRGELRLVFQASGISLVYSSGASVYVVGQSSQSAAQA